MDASKAMNSETLYLQIVLLFLLTFTVIKVFDALITLLLWTSLALVFLTALLLVLPHSTQTELATSWRDLAAALGSLAASLRVDGTVTWNAVSPNESCRRNTQEVAERHDTRQTSTASSPKSGSRSFPQSLDANDSPFTSASEATSHNKKQNTPKPITQSSTVQSKSASPGGASVKSNPAPENSLHLREPSGAPILSAKVNEPPLEHEVGHDLDNMEGVEALAKATDNEDSDEVVSTPKDAQKSHEVESPACLQNTPISTPLDPTATLIAEDREEDKDKVQKAQDFNLNFESYYEALGLVRTASKKDIVKAYRKKALTCHPDKVAPEFKDVAANLFKVITEAHDVLTDDALRVDYDRGIDIHEKPPRPMLYTLLNLPAGTHIHLVREMYDTMLADYAEYEYQQDLAKNYDASGQAVADAQQLRIDMEELLHPDSKLAYDLSLWFEGILTGPKPDRPDRIDGSTGPTVELFAGYPQLNSYARLSLPPGCPMEEVRAHYQVLHALFLNECKGATTYAERKALDTCIMDLNKIMVDLESTVRKSQYDWCLWCDYIIDGEEPQWLVMVDGEVQVGTPPVANSDEVGPDVIDGDEEGDAKQWY